MSCLSYFTNLNHPISRSDHTDCRNYTEKRNSITCNSMIYNFLQKLFVISILGLFLNVTNANAQVTSCDFTGSGLDLDGSGVQPVYLSCAAGRVEWNYPRAALRLTFRYPHAKGEFHGCIKANPEFEGARLYVEGHRSLIPLYSKDDGQPSDLMRCFTSHKGQVSLFLEADPSKSVRRKVSSFQYDLQPIPDGNMYDPMKECRPCTDSELVQLFCSSDFAAKGFITTTRDDPKMQRTVITLFATKVFQQTNPVFTNEPFIHGGGDDHSAVSKPAAHLHMNNKDWNLLSNHNLDVLRNPGAYKSDEQFRGTLHMPVQCGAKSGPGEYLFLGALRLGEPILRCAPKLQHWKSVVNDARDKAHCVLET